MHGDVCALADAGVTAEYADAILQIQDNALPVFREREWMIEAKRADLPASYGQALIKIRHDNGTPYFWHPASIIDAYRARLPAEYVSTIANLRMSNGDRALIDAEQVLETAPQMPPPELLQATLRQTDTMGKPAFNVGVDAVRFLKTDMSIDWFTAYLNAGFDGKSAYRLFSLGYQPSEALEFTDTPKPNAVVIYPQADPNGAFETPEAYKFFFTLRLHYDVGVRIVHGDTEAFAYARTIPYPELIVWSGHGDPYTVRFGEPGLRNPVSYMSPFYTYDTTDEKRATIFFQSTPSNAIIFLNSCSTAKGGEKETNIANDTIRYAQPRRIIASTIPFQEREIQIDQAYPFDARIMSRIGFGVSYDVTYSRTVADLPSHPVATPEPIPFLKIK